MADQKVGVTITGKDLLSPVVKGVNRTLADFKKSAMDGFGIAAGMKFTQLAGDAFRFLADEAQLAVKAARDLQEQQTKSTAVFKESNAAVADFAQVAARSFGLSEKASLEATGTIGNLLTAVGQTPEKAAEMSLSLVKLAADLASFNNRDVKEVITALQAGLVGEAEPARRLGINISMLRVENYLLQQGIVRTKSEITDAQKVWARYQIMLIDSANAQGDFARTSGNLANQQRILDAQIENLRANMGGLLLGPATGFVGFLNEIVNLLGDQNGVNPQIDRFIKGIYGIDRATQVTLGGATKQARSLEHVAFIVGNAMQYLAQAIGQPGTNAGKQITLLEKMDRDLLAMSVSLGLTDDSFFELLDAAAATDQSVGEFNLTLGRLYYHIAGEAKPAVNGFTGAMLEANKSFLGLGKSADGVVVGMENASTAFKMFETSADFTQLKPKEYFKGLREQIRDFRAQVRWLEKNPRFMEKVAQEYAALISSPAFVKLKESGGLLATGLIGNIEQWGKEMFGTIGDAELDPFLIPLTDKIAQRLGYDTGRKAGQKLLMGLSATIPGSYVIYQMSVRQWRGRGGNEAPGGIPSQRDPTGRTSNPITGFEEEDDRRKGGSGGSGVMGGRARPFRSYLVGERGPEWLVMGSQGGQIMPNRGGGDVVVNVDGEQLFRIMNKRMGRALAMGV